MADAPKRPGRKSSYTVELADRIIERVSQAETLTDICRDADMPDRVTVQRWGAANSEFASRLERARVDATHIRIDRALAAAYDASDDIKIDPKRGPVIDGWAVTRAALIVKTELQVAALVNPARYGQKIDLSVDDKRMDADERRSRIAELIAAANQVSAPADDATRH